MPLMPTPVKGYAPREHCHVNMRDDDEVVNAAESPPSNGPKKKRHGTNRKVLFVYRSPDEPDSDDDDDYSDSDIQMAHMAG